MLSCLHVERPTEGCVWPWAASVCVWKGYPCLQVGAPPLLVCRACAVAALKAQSLLRILPYSHFPSIGTCVALDCHCLYMGAAVVINEGHSPSCSFFVAFLCNTLRKQRIHLQQNSHQRPPFPPTGTNFAKSACLVVFQIHTDNVPACCSSPPSRPCFEGFLQPSSPSWRLLVKIAHTLYMCFYSDHVA